MDPRRHGGPSARPARSSRRGRAATHERISQAITEPEPGFTWANFRRQVDDLLESRDFQGASEQCRSCLQSAANNEIPLAPSDLCLVLLDYGDIRRKRGKYEDELVVEDMCFDLVQTVAQIRERHTAAAISTESAEPSPITPFPTRNAEPTVTPEILPYREHALEAIHAYQGALDLAIESNESPLQVRCYQRFSRLLLDLIYQDKIIANELLPNAALCCEQYLQGAAALRPREDETHTMLGQLYFEIHRYEDAKRHLETSCRIDRDNEQAWKLLGIIEGFHLHQIRIAARRLKKVLQMNGDLDNMYLIAHLLVCDDKLQQAYDVLRSAIAREQNDAASQPPEEKDAMYHNPDIHALFAWICTTADFFDPTLARRHYKIALSVDKEHLMGNLYLALYYAHIANQFTHAQAHFRLCYNIDKENDVILFFYGLLQKYQLENGRRGDKYLADASVDDLKTRDTQQNEPNFHTSNPCFCLSRLEFNNHYHGLSTWSVHQYYRQAHILLRHGKTPETVEVIRRILSLEEHEGARDLLRQLFERHEKDTHQTEEQPPRRQQNHHSDRGHSG